MKIKIELEKVVDGIIHKNIYMIENADTTLGDYFVISKAAETCLDNLNKAIIESTVSRLTSPSTNQP